MRGAFLLGLSLACSSAPAPRAALLPFPSVAAIPSAPPKEEPPSATPPPVASDSYDDAALRARPAARALAASFAVRHLLRPEDRGRPLLVVVEWLEPLTADEARRAIADERKAVGGPPHFGTASSIVVPHTYDHVRVELEDGMDGEDLFEITIEDEKRVVLVDRFVES